MSYLHGSSIPGDLEGGPLHNDSFLLTFYGTTDTNGVAVYVGGVVTLSDSASFTCELSVVQGDFILGVAQTSGQLQQAIDVICRGEVTVTTDASVTAGNYLDVSETSGHDGYVTNSPDNAATRMVALQTVNGSSTPTTLVALLF